MFLIIDQMPKKKIAKIFSNAAAVFKLFSREELTDSTIITQSLLSGLREKGTKFLFNDYGEQNDVDTVVVFDNVESLRWAIARKQRGLVKRLLVGPFISSLPSEARTLLFSAPIDGFIFIDRERRDLFLRMSPQVPRCTYVWSTGVEKFLEILQGQQPPAVPTSKKVRTQLTDVKNSAHRPI